MPPHLTALEGSPKVGVIMTTNIAKGPEEWKPHVHKKEKMEELKSRFSKPGGHVID